MLNLRILSKAIKPCNKLCKPPIYIHNKQYHELVIDHYEKPRNVGSLSKDDVNVGTGLVGAPACGDVMKLQILVDEETGVIKDVKFKTFGCGSAIASSSLATEKIKGLKYWKAKEIKNTEIAKELSLPPVKLHCSMLAEDAIKKAISDWESKKAARDSLKEIICKQEMTIEGDMDLYSHFNVAKDATIDEIKKAYRTLCLKCHPDKVSPEEKEQATERFQLLSTWYGILSDPVKRKNYDETGSIESMDTVFEGKGEETWLEFFRAMWEGLVTEDTINAYSASYKCSEKEQTDVLSAYVEHKGDMFAVIDSVPCSELSDMERFQEIIQNAIDSGECQEYAKFKKINSRELKKRQKNAAKEEIEAKEALRNLKEKSVQDIDDLKKLIQKNGKSRMDKMIHDLEAKATSDKPKGKAKSKRKEMPTDAEFAEIQSKMMKKKK